MSERSFFAEQGGSAGQGGVRAGRERSAASGQVNILIDNGAYRMDNLGDVAMLEVTVERVRRRWPAARVSVMTETPDRLRAAMPDVRAIEAVSWSDWPILPIPRRMRRGRLGDRLERWEERWQFEHPRPAHRMKRLWARRDAREPSLRAWFDAIASAHAVATCGGGLLNDWFHLHSRRVLTTLAIAQGLGKPTAMFGLGLGPISRPGLAELAGRVLGRLEVLALREDRSGPAELQTLGVQPHHLIVTGDDAIEPAYAARPAALGDRLGINIRLAPHARLPEDVLPTLGRALQDAAAKAGAALCIVPVRSRLSPDNDLDSARRLLLPTQAMDLDRARNIDHPQKLIAEIGQCRVVVTGSYHAAIFALAQGVPVVGLAQSRYYQNKLGGAAEQFAVGMRVLNYDQPNLPARVREAVGALWAQAPRLRSPLAQAALAQIRESRAAYDRFFDRVERRRDAEAVKEGGRR